MPSSRREAPAAESFEVLERLRDGEIAGGAADDAVIAESAVRGGARSLLALNRRHVERAAPDGLEIVEPV